jgi:hypothetical protein
MRRVLSLLAVLALAALAPTASAEAPVREDIPPIQAFVSLACGFPVLVEGVQEKEKALFFGDPPDHAIITGVLKWRLTNTATSKSIESNISGPVHAVVTADGTGSVIRHEGRTLFLIGPGLAARLGIEPGLFLSTGMVVVEVKFSVGITSIHQMGGTWTPLCPRLA